MHVGYLCNRKRFVDFNFIACDIFITDGVDKLSQGKKNEFIKCFLL